MILKNEDVSGVQKLLGSAKDKDAFPQMFRTQHHAFRTFCEKIVYGKSKKKFDDNSRWAFTDEDVEKIDERAARDAYKNIKNLVTLWDNLQHDQKEEFLFNGDLIKNLGLMIKVKQPIFSIPPELNL